MVGAINTCVGEAETEKSILKLTRKQTRSKQSIFRPPEIRLKPKTLTPGPEMR